MKKIKDLIKAIQESDLSEENKIILIAKLNEQNLDIKDFIELFISLLGLSKGIIDLFNL